MKAKTARRFFARNAYKIMEKKCEEKVFLFGYFNRKKYKSYLKALRMDQGNPASRRAYQQALFLLK